MSLLFRKYDPATGKEYIGDIASEPDCVGTPAHPTVLARKQARAQRYYRNQEQNIGRAYFAIINDDVDYAPATTYIAPFDTFNTMPVQARMFRDEPNPSALASGIAFVCQEAGFYNVKGGLHMRLSLPQAALIKMTMAEAELLYQPADRTYSSVFWQATEYAPIRVIAGTPPTTEQLYLRGFSLTFAEKFFLDCGDVLWLDWYFLANAGIAFVELFEGRLAIQRTGEPFITEDCC